MHTTQSGSRSSRASSAIAFVLTLAAASGFAQAPLPFETEAIAAYQAREYDRCATLWTRAAKEYPAHFGYPFQAARCHHAAGRRPEAERFLDIALKRGFRSCAILPFHTPEIDARCEANADGKQFRPGPDGKMTMEPFDRKAVADKERMRHGIDLGEQEKRLAAMNQ